MDELWLADRGGVIVGLLAVGAIIGGLVVVGIAELFDRGARAGLWGDE